MSPKSLQDSNFEHIDRVSFNFNNQDVYFLQKKKTGHNIAHLLLYTLAPTHIDADYNARRRLTMGVQK